MRVSRSALLCSVLLLFSSSSWAQDWASYFVLEEVLLRGSSDPSLDAATAMAQPTLILETSENGNARVKGRVGVEVGKQLVLDLQVEGPKKSEETTLASLDGLNDSSTAELGFTWISKNPSLYASARMTSMSAVKAGSNDLNDYGKKTLIRPSAIEALGAENYRVALNDTREAMKDSIPVFLTARAKAGRNDFSFVDSSTLRPGQESHTNRELTAEVGAYLRGTFYTSLSYRQGKTFSAGRTAELCAPFGSTDALECRKLTVGSPTEADIETLGFEIRRLFGSVGFAARIKRDLENDVTGIEVPIYFLQKLGTSDMELNGGIAVKWRSDTEDYAVSAFIGPALSTVFRR